MSRQTEGQQIEAGRTVKALARERGRASEATLYTWKSKYRGIEVNEARRLKHMAADQSLEKGALGR